MRHASGRGFIGRIWRVLVITLACIMLTQLLCISTVLIAGNISAKADEIWYTRSGTKLRQKASTSSGAIVTIKGGEEVAVSGKSGGWSRVSYRQHEGYVRSDLLVQLTRSGYIPLEKGNECPQVKDVQVMLRDLGYFTGKCDGKFGEDTEAAVKVFQKNNGITADGVAGGETQRTLFNGGARFAPGLVTSVPNQNASSNNGGLIDPGTASNVLKKGDQGSSVKAMQTQLKNLGYISFTPDGVFGSGTETAVMEFQRRNSLSADGKAGTATLAALSGGKAVKAAAAAPSATPSTKLTLKRGDSGSEVAKMQQRLRELGYINFAADGNFGSGTRTGVISFQKGNKLTADGIAGPGTLTLLYSSSAKASVSGGSSGSSGSSSASASDGPASSQVKLLHFFDTVKEKYKTGTVVTVYDPASRLSWKLRFMSLGRHADSEPQTASDTAAMNKAFGNATTWTPKAVWVKFPDGVWSMATMHNTPHLSSSIKDNNFNGHLCVHFLRDMSEVNANDPNYGVQNQKALRAAWKALTGETIN